MASLDSTVMVTVTKRLKQRESSPLSLSEKYSFKGKAPYKINKAPTYERGGSILARYSQSYLLFYMLPQEFSDGPWFLSICNQSMSTN